MHATTELALTEVGVDFLRFPARFGMHTFPTEAAFGAVGLDGRELEYLLWDRILHRELTRSGKTVLVHKAPRVLLRWRRLAECWPAARYVFLLRHPVHILASVQAHGPHLTSNEVIDFCLRFLYLLQEARQTLHGLTVRYEDLTADPASACRSICEFLGLGWERAMLEYGATDRGRLLDGIGDMSDNIQSGRVRPGGRPLPPEDEIPRVLKPICAHLGYIGASGTNSGAAQPTLTT